MPDHVATTFFEGQKTPWYNYENTASYANDIMTTANCSLYNPLLHNFYKINMDCSKKFQQSQ